MAVALQHNSFRDAMQYFREHLDGLVLQTSGEMEEASVALLDRVSIPYPARATISMVFERWRQIHEGMDALRLIRETFRRNRQDLIAIQDEATAGWTWLKRSVFDLARIHTLFQRFKEGPWQTIRTRPEHMDQNLCDLMGVFRIDGAGNLPQALPIAQEDDPEHRLVPRIGTLNLGDLPCVIRAHSAAPGSVSLYLCRGFDQKNLGSIRVVKPWLQESIFTSPKITLYPLLSEGVERSNAVDENPQRILEALIQAALEAISSGPNGTLANRTIEIRGADTPQLNSLGFHPVAGPYSPYEGPIMTLGGPEHPIATTRVGNTTWGAKIAARPILYRDGAV